MAIEDPSYDEPIPLKNSKDMKLLLGTFFLFLTFNGQTHLLFTKNAGKDPMQLIDDWTLSDDDDDQEDGDQREYVGDVGYYDDLHKAVFPHPEDVGTLGLDGQSSRTVHEEGTIDTTTEAVVSSQPPGISSTWIEYILSIASDTRRVPAISAASTPPVTEAIHEEGLETLPTQESPPIEKTRASAQEEAVEERTETSKQKQ